MTQKQKESTAKYLYDISKGIALLAVVDNLVRGKGDALTLIFGFIGALIIFTGGYIMEVGIEK
jgi:hypothetical protein